jgi:hypothetical protein
MEGTGSMELMALAVVMVNLDCRASKALLVLLVLMAQQVQQAREVRLGVRVRLVIRVLRGPLVVKALAALLVRVAA